MNILGQDLQRLAAHTAREARPRLAADPYHQRFHLMPPVGWMNDPNGLCFDGTFYHVFYQYGPFDPTGGVKFWGHYRSRDLLRWDSLPPMLCPDEPWNVHGVYSGSALVEDGRLYLYYTGNVLHGGAHDYTHSGREHNTALAVSSDGVTVDSNECLMHNCDYPRGLTCHVRDPKVWAQNGRYYMVQGARTSDDRGEVLVFESADKRHWTHINTITTPEKFGYMWECPDLFELDGQWFLALSPQGVTKQETITRTSIPAVIFRCTEIFAATARSARSGSWISALTSTRRRAFRTADAVCSSAGWVWAIFRTATRPYRTAGSTA